MRYIITFALHNNLNLFNKHLLSADYVPGTILSVGNIAVKTKNKTATPTTKKQKIPTLMGKNINIPNIAELSV